MQQNTSILNAQVISRDPGVFVNNCVSKGREDMVSMGCVRGWGIGYMEVHTVSTYVSVAKQGYSSCPCRVSLMSFQRIRGMYGYGAKYRSSATSKRDGTIG